MNPGFADRRGWVRGQYPYQDANGLLGLPGHEAKGIPVFERVQTLAVGDGRTSSANQVETAVSTGPAAGTIRFGQFGAIDIL